MPNHTLQVALSLLALPDFCCSSAFASVGFSFPKQRVVTPGGGPGTGDTGPGGAGVRPPDLPHILIHAQSRQLEPEIIHFHGISLDVLP